MFEEASPESAAADEPWAARAAGITGIGMVTPAGLTARETWARLVEGRPTTAADPRLAGAPVRLTCRVEGFDARAHRPRRVPQRLDPHLQFALAAAREAVEDAGLRPDDWDPTRVAIVMGSCCGGVTTYEEQHRKFTEGRGRISPLLLPLYLPNMAAGQLSVELNACGPSLTTTTACASGATAVGTALHLLRAGLCDIALAGGTEAMITPLTIRSLAAAGALTRNPDPLTATRPFDAGRDGFVMGEGAAVLVLERPREAAVRGRRPYALLAGYGASADAHDPVAPHPEGLGAARAVRAALLDAQAGPEDIDHVNAHGTSTVLNDLIEARVLAHLLRPGTPVTSAKGVVGHMMGAAGAVEAACTALSVAHRIVPPIGGTVHRDPAARITTVTGAARRHRIRLAMSNSFGFGGQNAVLVFREAPSGPPLLPPPPSETGGEGEWACP